MGQNSGVIYKTDKGDYGLAINKEQRKEFADMGKVLVHLYEDLNCTIPKIDPATGQPFGVLKHYIRLEQLGFCD